jgi:PPOX class probable F420-dependent enzyme
MQPLTPLARELVAGPNFAVAATINSDGSPQQSVVWVRERDGEVIFSTVEGRAKPRNLVRDLTISVLVIDRENGYRYSAIHGQARLETSNADEVIDELSHKYTGGPWVETQTRPRVTVVVTPTRITDHGE